jgi:hypothetical protein
MNLNHVQKVILGIFTFLPFVLFPLFLWQMFHSLGHVIFFGDRYDADSRDVMMPVFAFIIPVVLSGMGALALLIFYVAHVVLNKKIEGSEQLLWIILFIIVGIFAFPAYWFLRIWNNPDKS